MTTLQDLESPSPRKRNFLVNDSDDDGTASQRSISLSSPSVSPRHSVALTSIPLTEEHDEHGPTPKRISKPYTVDTDISSEAEGASLYTRDREPLESPVTSAAPSVFEEVKTPEASFATPMMSSAVTYPPRSLSQNDNESVDSFASGSSRKARPESVLILPANTPLILGIALVDFNHLVGPRIEFSQGDIFEDEEVVKILPFLALPDGAHMSSEDFSYFHLVPSGPKPSTIFGISCNRQIAASNLLVKDSDVTRSTVQKAVVILASKPVFGPIRDKLGVVTQALFDQRDFSSLEILKDFGSSLEASLRSQLTESGLYMGTSLRELVHTFRHRTLVLVKALMLQRKLMFYGHPVERLCTYQYSLVTLFPGLLQYLDDCGSPPLNNRAPTLSRPVSLRTSDRKSLMAYIGLPLDLFGKDAFFQPYLPLQQLDMIMDTQSWLCGSTNSIVTQRKEIDILINTETDTLEFRNLALERALALTAADRKWMDDIVRDVNEGWDEEDPTRPQSIQFKGSDDYLRAKFEEYISASLALLKYQDFISKGENSGVLISGGAGGETNAADDFNPVWLSEFRQTQAYQVWDRITDPLLFDIVEPRHPCMEKPSVVADIGLRLSEGIQDLKLEQQLGPAREAVSRTLATGSTSFFKAVEGVRDRWAQRSVTSPIQPETPVIPNLPPKPSEDTTNLESTPPPPQPISSRFSFLSRRSSSGSVVSTAPTSPSTISQPPPTIQPVATAATTTLSSWGSGIGSFWASKSRQTSTSEPPTTVNTLPVIVDKDEIEAAPKPLQTEATHSSSLPPPTTHRADEKEKDAHSIRRASYSDDEGPAGMAL